jgi:hypothetical protein
MGRKGFRSSAERRHEEDCVGESGEAIRLLSRMGWRAAACGRKQNSQIPHGHPPSSYSQPKYLW